jgi:predicted membrane metal-binding protein
MLLLAIAIVPTATTVAHRVVTCAVALLLWGIGWLTAFQWSTIRDWMMTFGGAA